MKHNFKDKSVRNLIELRGCLLGTLKNERCEPLFKPTKQTISQINSELEARGIKSLLKSKQ